MKLNDAEIAALADHEAVPLGLPRRIEAWLVLRASGRIDTEKFSLHLSLEPQQFAYAWVNYERQGALVTVGERQWRLTPRQLALFDAVEKMRTAGGSIEGRLRAWPLLMAALEASSGGQMRVDGHLPRVLLKEVETWPAGSRTRVGKILRPPQGAWAMGPGHRYYLKVA